MTFQPTDGMLNKFLVHSCQEPAATGGHACAACILEESKANLPQAHVQYQFPVMPPRTVKVTEDRAEDRVKDALYAANDALTLLLQGVTKERDGLKTTLRAARKSVIAGEPSESVLKVLNAYQLLGEPK